jgi:hypothetical protein
MAVMGAAASSGAAAQVAIHVSPGGSDSGDGSVNAPVQTLMRAQALVRKANRRDDVVVHVGAGTYRLKQPLRFDRRDGGRNGHSVSWRGEAGAMPLISSGFEVTGFSLVDEERRLYVADVPQGLDTRQVWVNDTRAERPWVEIEAGDLKFSVTGFTVVNPELDYIGNLRHPDRLEVEATGFFTDRYSPVASIDGMTVTMEQPAWDNNTWGYDTLTRPVFPDDSRLFLVNAPELIGRANHWHALPYQWFVDPEEGKLYLHIAEDDDIADLTVVVPTLEALVSIAGTPEAPIENLTFEGLRFSHTSWLGPSRPTGYANQQSGAYLHDVSPIRPEDAWSECGWGCAEFESMRQLWHQQPAAVQVAAARKVTFRDNQFSQLGQIGLGIGNDATANLSGEGLAARDIRVLGNRFAVLSGGAIMLGGVRLDAHHPSDESLINRNILIAGNTIFSVSQDYKDNAAILSTYVAGASIVHNDLSDAPYDGIAVGWGWGYNDAGGNPNYAKNQQGYLHNPRFETPTTLRDTLVAGNRIHGVKTWFMDGGAIYNLSANPGAVIRDNHIFDIGDRIGIYLDEGSKHIAVTGNVVETRGKWLNINTAGSMYRERISTDNTASGNWHTSRRTGGRWLDEIGNYEHGNFLTPDADWPDEARRVIDKAGVRAYSGKAESRVRPKPTTDSNFPPEVEVDQSRVLGLLSTHDEPVIGPNHPDVLSSNNRSGFETGQVVKLEGTYHMFVNEMFDRPHRDLRISYWTSRDAIDWKRQSTLVESIPGRSPANPRSEVWATGVEFDDEENAWNIFYVAYRAGDKEKGELEGSDYEGRIWRAKSVVRGLHGIAGPYADIGIVLQPDENSQPWEGQQAVATFNPYKVGEKWYAFYDGHTHIPQGPWPVGLATAPRLAGPWVRMPEGINPLPIAEVFLENPQVTQLEEGGYLAVFDSFGDQEIGYSTSSDGVRWSPEVRIRIQAADNLWSEAGDHAMRTPLCVIEEDDGSFTVLYTARMNNDGGPFYALGKSSLAWQ